MGVTEVEHEALALLRGAVTDADDLELLRVAVGDTHDHVVDQGSRQPVESAVLRFIVRAADMEHGAVHFHLDGSGGGIVEFALRTLDGDQVVFSYVYGNACGNRDRSSANSGHSNTSSFLSLTRRKRESRRRRFLFLPSYRS